MKKQIFLLATILLTCCLARGQDTLRNHHVYEKDTSVASTVSFKMYATVDSIIIYPKVDTAAIVLLKCGTQPPIDTGTPPPVNKLGRILYVGSTEFVSVLRQSVARQEFKWYLQDYGYTGVSYYGMGNISSADFPALRALNKDLRVNYGITHVEATGSSLSSLQARISFNNGCTDAREKFNVYNNEDEYWNADPNADGTHSDAEVLAAWKVDSASMIPMKAAADAAGLGNRWYHGWPIKNVIPLHMLRKLSVFQYHIYTPGTPNMNYGDSRWKDANTACVMDNVSAKPASVIISAESAFSGPWLATHSLDEFEAMCKVKLAQYPRLKLTDIQVFMYSKIKQYQKPKRTVPVSGLARMATPAPQDTTTSRSHLETAIER